jgi:hypothetical protein
VEILNDTIMGGASSSAVRHCPQRGALLFSGELVAANGGFASFRCGPRAWCRDDDDDAAAGVRVVLAAADGGAARELKVTARSDDAWDGVGYQACFTLPAGEQPTTLLLPFSAFRCARLAAAAALTHAAACCVWRACVRASNHTRAHIRCHRSATFRGREVAGAPPLRGATLRRLGVMVSRYDSSGRAMPHYACGPFALAVFEIGTYDG